MKKNFCSIIVFFFLFFGKVCSANNLQVYYAGFSFLGDKKGQFNGMPLTTQLLQEKINNIDAISYVITDNLKKTNPKNFKLNFSMADLEKGESIIMSIGIVKESHTEEYNTFSRVYNNNIELFLQILFYDFKERKLIAAIPIYGELNFITEIKATNMDKLKYLKQFYFNELINQQGQKIGVSSEIKRILENFELKEKYSNRIGVTNVYVEDSAKKEIPEYILKNIDNFKTALAQNFSASLAFLQGVAVVPYIEGVAIGGLMKQKFVNSAEIYNIQLPNPDFYIEIGISNFKKGLAETSDISELWQYGSAINFKIFEPLLNKEYLNDRLRRVTNIQRAKGTEIDHWGKFYFNNQMLFQEFIMNISNQDRTWMENASDKNEFKNQLEEVKKLLVKVR